MRLDRILHVCKLPANFQLIRYDKVFTFVNGSTHRHFSSSQYYNLNGYCFFASFCLLTSCSLKQAHTVALSFSRRLKDGGYENNCNRSFYVPCALKRTNGSEP